MKILFISDIHGVATALENTLHQAEALEYERIVLLGDLLYHGPRNGVPSLYAPTKVASILNSLKEKILAVRGNCDTEVDQMMLDFPILSDYAELDADGQRFFLTHGHHWNANNLPPLGTGNYLVHGHTHIAELRPLPCGITIFNPGSISLPKGGQSPSFGYWNGTQCQIIPLQTP